MENDYLYIDKTKYLHMLKDRGKFYFMSRPRRFGKSLTISTYDCMFRGEKELFKDTWLYDNWDFEPRPVIQLNMSELDTRDEKRVEENIIYLLDELYATHSIVKDTNMMKIAFATLIKRIYEKYDKPILDHLEDHEMAEKIRMVFDAYLDFVFITGITKFTKVGVFSTLNNLDDISTWDDVSQMLGYTQEELERDFDPYLEACESSMGMNKQELFDQIKQYYNGFSFDGKNFVYNPFSILNFLNKGQFKNYWVESGSPSFIVKYAKRHEIKPDKVLGKYVRETILSAYEIEAAPPVSFLIQVGYLIDYPNKEVRDSFSELLMISEYNHDLQEANEIRDEIRQDLKNRDFERLYE